MAEGVDAAEAAISQTLATEIAPPSRPRDQAGKFVTVAARPEPMFGERETEGSDAGDDPRRRSREQEVQRGKTGRQTDRDDPNDIPGAVATDPERVGARSGDDDAPLDADEQAVAEGRSRDAEDAEGGDDEGTKYEIIVDGQPSEVSLREALNGYVRTETFHRRMNELSQFKAGLDEEHQRQQANWQLLMRAKEAYEADIKTMMPPEPDWDREFAINPAQAHHQQKIYQGLYAALAKSQNERTQMAAIHKQEADRRLQKYAEDGYTSFVFESKLNDKQAIEKEIASMRRTALAEGFSEQEIATVYDKRMLHILRKASKYDRMMAAAKPQAVVPGKGKSMSPGAATPLGNAPRKSLDEASRQLASSGRLEDAAEWFRRSL